MANHSRRTRKKKQNDNQSIKIGSDCELEDKSSKENTDGASVRLVNQNKKRERKEENKGQ